MLILIVEVRKLIQKNLNESNGLFLHRGMLEERRGKKKRKMKTTVHQHTYNISKIKERDKL